MEGNPVVEFREEFTTYDNPLVKHPSTADTTFHFPMEDKYGSSYWVSNHPTDDIERVAFGPNAPFWRIFLG